MERRLPPALEEKVRQQPLTIAVEDILDWLYGIDRCQGCEDAPIGQHTAPHEFTPGLVERVMKRIGVVSNRDMNALNALRAELGMEES